jgi:hypothetical protein
MICRILQKYEPARVSSLTHFIDPVYRFREMQISKNFDSRAIRLVCLAFLLCFGISFNAGAQYPWGPDGEKGVVKGAVVYPATNKPAPNARLTFWPVDWDRPINGRLPSTTSDADGKYSTELPAGRWQVCPDKQEENHLSPLLMPFGLAVGGRCEHLTTSAARPQTIDLVLAPAVGSLHGKITNWKNLSLPKETTIVLYRPLKRENDQWVLTTTKDATWNATAKVFVEKNGTFIINGLPEGDYFLRMEIPEQNPWFYTRETGKIKIKNAVINEIEFSYF